MNKYLVFTGIGFELVSLLGASIWLGLMIDKYFELKGVFTIILCVSSLISWLVHVVILAKKMENK